MIGNASFADAEIDDKKGGEIGLTLTLQYYFLPGNNVSVDVTFLKYFL